MKTLAIALFAATLVAQESKPLFSEDFESGELNKSIWSIELTGNNILEVQQDRAAHGKYALLVRCPEPSQRTLAMILATNLPAPLRRHHFGRAYVYVTSKLPARHTILLTAGTTGFPKYKYEEVATVRDHFQLTYVDQIENGEDYHSGGSEVPLGRWFCLEWEFNDNPNTAAVWVDGEKIYETGFMYKEAGNTNLVGGFTDVGFGFRLWGAAPDPFEIYYDDIAIDTKRIGPISDTRLHSR